MKAILVGPDGGLGEALEAGGATVTRIDGVATGDRLDAAGVAEADVLIVGDVGEATAISVAKSENPSLKVVLYTDETMPEFVRGQVDLAIDPALLSADVVADELLGGG